MLIILLKRSKYKYHKHCHDTNIKKNVDMNDKPIHDEEMGNMVVFFTNSLFAATPSRI